VIVDSFRLYDADNDRKILRRDFSDFFEKSCKERRQDILQLATQIFNSLADSKKNVRGALLSFYK
jgi:hypothetical protein